MFFFWFKSWGSPWPWRQRTQLLVIVFFCFNVIGQSNAQPWGVRFLIIIFFCVPTVSPKVQQQKFGSSSLCYFLVQVLQVLRAKKMKSSTPRHRDFFYSSATSPKDMTTMRSQVFHRHIFFCSGHLSTQWQWPRHVFFCSSHSSA